jgi:hypothetical protein
MNRKTSSRPLAKQYTIMVGEREANGLGKSKDLFGNKDATLLRSSRWVR